MRSFKLAGPDDGEESGGIGGLLRRHPLMTAIVGLIFVVNAVLILFGGDSTPTPPPDQTSASSPSKSSRESTAYKLAMIHEKSEIPTGDSIRAFQALLSDLHGKCIEEEEHLGNLLVRSYNILQDDGIRVTLLGLGDELNTSTSALQSEGQNCLEHLAVITTLMQESRSYR